MRRGRIYKGFRIVYIGYHHPDHCVWWEAQSLVTNQCFYHETTRRELKAAIDRDTTADGHSGAIAIPKAFFDDHAERDLPTPKILATERSCYWIPVHGAETDELLADAKFYADPDVGWDISPGLRSSARATVKAIKEARAALALEKGGAK